MEEICKQSGTQIISRHIKTPIAEYWAKVCGEGAHYIHPPFEGSLYESEQNINVLESNPPLTLTGDAKDPNATMNKLVEWFHFYFTDLAVLEKAFPQPFPSCTPDASEFRKKVWKTVQENTSVGNTITYGEIAKIIEKPYGSLAVRAAMRMNPNCLVVPCHRVIKSDTQLGHINCGGEELKRWLLEYEKKAMMTIADAKSVEVKGNGVAA